MPCEHGQRDVCCRPWAYSRHPFCQVEKTRLPAEMLRLDNRTTCYLEFKPPDFRSSFRPPSAMNRLRKAASKSDDKSSHWGRFPTTTGPNRPTRRRLWSRGCDGFASSRSCRASPATCGAGSGCRLQPRSAARDAGPRRSSFLSRRKNTKGVDMLDYWLDLQVFVLPMALRTAYCCS